tara:strand:+ start:85 stop:882 length:798 start_codon:yes stop_codon:yes gene_type:complete
MKLQKTFLPKFKTSLIRVGKENDGGYCVPKKSVMNSDLLISFGLNDDWSFEKDFISINSKTKVFVFDKNVSITFWIKNFLKTIIEIISFKKSPISIFKFVHLFFDYLIFFRNSNSKHFKKNVIQKNHIIKNQIKSSYINLKEILSKDNGKNFFLKIDIEGNEYRILQDIIENQNYLEGLVIEFHNSDLMEDKIIDFSEQLSLDLVHVHVNNFGDTNNKGYATTFEATYSPRKYNNLREKDEFIFPVKGLDQPNNEKDADEKVFFE